MGNHGTDNSRGNAEKWKDAVSNGRGGCVGNIPKSNGKVVDFITHSIDDGTLYFTVKSKSFRPKIEGFLDKDKWKRRDQLAKGSCFRLLCVPTLSAALRTSDIPRKTMMRRNSRGTTCL